MFSHDSWQSVASRFSSEPEPLVVRGARDLEAVARFAPLPHPFRKPPISLQTPQLDAAEAAHWEERFGEVRRQGGNRPGIIGMIAFSAAAVLLLGLGALGHPAQWSFGGTWLRAGLLILGLVVSGGVGQFVGLLVRERAYHRACRALRRRLEGNPSAPANPLDVARRRVMQNLLR